MNNLEFRDLRDDNDVQNDEINFGKFKKYGGIVYL